MGRARLARTGGLMPKTLLLADDSIVIQKLVGLSFASEDVQIVATDNGDDAIARAREVVPDVVLADVVMPGKNGYEVCEAIKQDARLAHIPVLLLTGTFEVFDEARATRAGADGQITKPFEARALVERVNEYMNRPAAGQTTHQTDGQGIEAATVAMEEDLFDPNVTTLSPLEASPVPKSEAGPGQRDRGTRAGGRHSESTAADSTDISSSMLFGAPGEGASEDDFEPAIGGLALGQTVSNVEGARASDPRPREPEPALGSASMTSTSTEDFRAFEDDLGLDAPLEFSDSLSDSLSVSTDDLDEELGSNEDDATWLTGLQQPRDDDPFSFPDGMDEARDEAERRDGSDRSQARTSPSPSVPIPVPIPAQQPGPMSSREASAQVDLGPASVASDDLEFGFDVSEQVSADPLDDSFGDALGSSIADENADEAADEEGASTMSPTPAARIPDPSAVEPPRSAASWDTEDILVGYDVSTSDLALDPTEPASTSGAGVEVSEPIPASAAFEMPQSLPPQRVQSAEATGTDAGREADDLNLEMEPSREISAPEACDDTIIVAEPGWLRSEPLSERIELEGDPEPAPAAVGIEQEPIHATAGPADAGDRRISDLSPLMEQRIQETLEKVAWEAFADLSESIVKQVMSRVEQIAWEVIPQMAETLVREEIRRMKGEDD